jgi:hypothetical protein
VQRPELVKLVRAHLWKHSDTSWYCRTRARHQKASFGWVGGVVEGDRAFPNEELVPKWAKAIPNRYPNKQETSPDEPLAINGLERYPGLQGVCVGGDSAFLICSQSEGFIPTFLWVPR